MSRRVVNRLIAWVGIIAVIAAATLIATTLIGQKRAAENTADTVAMMLSIMPEQKSATTHHRTNTEMAMLEVDGVNYVGILEVPKFQCTLPIGGIWDTRSVADYPHRFAGSVYDGTLVIGGSDRTGQLDFVKVITSGDLLSMTDTEGSRHSFLVEDVVTTTDVSRENLCDGAYDLTLFVRNTYAFDYTVIRCRNKGE